MKPDLDESLLSQFHAPIFDGAKGEEATRAMSVSEVPVSSLLETFPVLTWAVTPDGVTWYLNQRAVDYTGRSLSDFLRLGWVDLIHPEDREETLRTWSHAVQSGSSYRVKHRIRRADGEYRWFLALAEPLRDREGRVIQFFGLNVDIDESVKREAEIRRLFDANIVGIVFWDLDGGIRDANDAFLRIVGYERADLLSGGLRWADMTPPEWLKRDRECAEQQVRLTGSAQAYEKEFFRKDGSRVPVLIGGAAFDQEIKHGVAFVVDITARKCAEEELRCSQQYLAEAQRLAHMGSWTFDAVGFDYWSPELFRIYGLEAASKAPTVQEYLDCVHPQDREFMAELIRRILAEPSRFDTTKRIVRPGGEVRYIRCVGAPVVENQRLTKYVGSAIDVTDQELLTQELRSHEAYLAEAQRLSHTGSFGWKPDTGEIIWSAETYRIFEYDRAVTPTIDLVARRVHPEDRADFQSVIERVSGGASDFEHAYRLLLPDGRAKHVHALAHATQDASGNREFVGAVTDITAQKRAEETLRESEAYLAEAQKLSHTGSWAWNPEKDIRYWSEECYRVLSFDPRDGLPRFEEFFQRIHPDDQPDFRKLIQTAIREKAEWEADYRIVHPDGPVRDIHVLGHPVLSTSGDLVEFVGTVIDITERKRAEEELRASERKYRHLVDTTPAFVHTALPNGDLDFFNRGWLEYLGLSITDLLGWRWTSAIHPEDVEELVAKWRAALESGEPFVAESRVRRADGKYRWFLHRKQPQRNEAGEIVKWYGSSIEIEERKIAEEKLQQSEAYLAEAQKLSHTGSWAWSPDTDVRYWSEECYRVLGFDPRDGLPRMEELIQRIHPDDQPAFRESARRTRHTKLDEEVDYRIVHPGGAVRDIHSIGHPVFSPSGDLVEFVGTVMDITERKRAEEERREHLWFLESMDRINRAMQRTNDVEGMMSGVLEETLAIFGSDRAWVVYPCNPDAATCRAVMEHTRPEYPGAFARGEELPLETQAAEVLRRVLDAPGAATDLSVPPEMRERFSIQSIIAIAVRPKGDRPYLFGLHQCSHARVWTAAERRLFEEIARRLEDALTSVLAHRNLLASEEELRRSRAYLAEAQKVSHTGSWAWNNVTRENVYWSEECFRIHGRDPALVPPSLEQILADIHPEDVPGIVASLEEALREGRDWEGEYRLVNFADDPRTVRTIAHPVPDRSGRVVEYIGTVVDITEQKRAEQELRTSELERARAEHALRDAREKLAQASKIATVAELSATIAHEINQPLQAVVANGHACLRWLAATPPNVDKATRTADRIVRDGNAAADVVNRIRALFKHASPAKVDLDINKLILQVPTLMADEIQGNGVSLETELGEDVPTIRADAVQIQQVIVNLVRNAIEAMAATMERPKPLWIRSRREEDNVVVGVQDHGVGLADSEKIFEPFITTKETGLGMGLAICRSIIEAHAGRIWAARNPEQGVTFSFSLPSENSGTG